MTSTSVRATALVFSAISLAILLPGIFLPVLTVRGVLTPDGIASMTPVVLDRGLDEDTEGMVRAAAAFLAGLDPAQRAQASFSFEDAERLNWHFIPRERQGLPLKQMAAGQRERARALLATGLSARGLVKTDAIIELENVLRELGGDPAMRDPELYFVSIFGTPSPDGAWGWRFEGHHLSLNFTVVGGRAVATAPAFLGAHPAEVRSGSRQGLRALAPEEDLARELVTSLDAQQRPVAIISADAPTDIVTGTRLDIDPLSPAGIGIDRLDAAQAARLRRLVDEYLARMAEPLAAARRARLEASDFGRITFAWAGSIERGRPHYYRVQGPTFLIEYDNTQNGANHIHSVWRDFAGDFGRDLLREHYRRTPHPH
jgi:hypothetical protein